MKYIALILTVFVSVTLVFAVEYTVDDLLVTRGDAYKMLLDNETRNVSQTARVRQNATPKELLLLDILKSRKSVPEIYVTLDRMLITSREKRSNLSIQDQQHVSPRSALLISRLLLFALWRNGVFKSNDTRLAIVEALWKFVIDDYERLCFMLALSKLDCPGDELVPIVCGVMRETEHPQVLVNSILLLSKIDAVYSDTTAKREVLNAIELSLPFCVDDPECRSVYRIMLQKIGGTESEQLITALEPDVSQKTDVPVKKVPVKDIVIDVNE
jgi:hypothetical protein